MFHFGEAKQTGAWKQSRQKPSSKYGFEPFGMHFEPMMKWAGKLADELGGDKEVILVAAWLHDIGSIVDGRKKHHLTGPRIARKKLSELGFPEKKIKLGLLPNTVLLRKFRILR